MKVGLILTITCLWILNIQAQVSWKSLNQNLKDKILNNTWISQQKYKKCYRNVKQLKVLMKLFFYPKNHKRENGEQIQLNMPDEPYSVGMEEALVFRQHYFRENDNDEKKLVPDKDYNDIHFIAHRKNIINAHRIVPHHLEHYSSFERPEGYIGIHYKYFGNDSSEGKIATRSGIRGKIQNIGHQIKRLFDNMQLRKNATTDKKSIKRSKFSKRSEFELVPKWRAMRKSSSFVADRRKPYQRDKKEFINKFIMPRIAQLSLHGKSSGKFDTNIHISCEKDPKTQHIKCKNSEINILQKEENSELRSNPNSKTRILNIPENENSNQNFKYLIPKDDSSIHQA